MLLHLLFMLMMKSCFVSNYLAQQTLLTLDSIFFQVVVSFLNFPLSNYELLLLGLFM